VASQETVADLAYQNHVGDEVQRSAVAVLGGHRHTENAVPALASHDLEQRAHAVRHRVEIRQRQRVHVGGHELEQIAEEEHADDRPDVDADQQQRQQREDASQNREQPEEHHSVRAQDGNQAERGHHEDDVSDVLRLEFKNRQPRTN
jgi:hypothetical protein